jgi:hypothetical protein
LLSYNAGSEGVVFVVPSVLAPVCLGPACHRKLAEHQKSALYELYYKSIINN